MTLPFRRRHHDDETSHDRARAILGGSFLETPSGEDEAWYEGHLESCPECRVEREAYIADRELLRGLRDRTPEPPRDLWARTATRLEHEAGRRGRGPSLAFPSPMRRRTPGPVPLGVLSGALVVLVLVATSILGPGGGTPVQSTAAGSQIARIPTPSTPGATPLSVVTQPLGWIRQTADGSYQLVFADVNRVCPDSKTTGCAPLAEGTTAPISLAAPPQAVVLSPSAQQLIVATGGGSGAHGEVLVVPVPDTRPTGGPTDSPPPSAVTPTASSSSSTRPPLTPTPTPTPTRRPTASPTLPVPGGDTTPPSPSIPPATPNPDGSYAIVSGVVLVGQPRYSPDGRWLAFSARPMDGSGGPDLYLWRVGADLAERVTDDQGTYFAGWEAGMVLASRVEVEPTPDASASPVPSTSTLPSTKPSGRASPHATPPPTLLPVPSTASSSSPDASASPRVIETGHPVSFVLDPETLEETVLPWDDMWQPVVDPSGRTVVFWSGTLVREQGSIEWTLGDGSVVLDSMTHAAVLPSMSPAASGPGGSPAPSVRPSSHRPTNAPASSPIPLATASPNGASPDPGSPQPSEPIALSTGSIVAFEVRFDPTGTRLALWTTDTDQPATPAVGLLRLLLVDPATATVMSSPDPLPGEPALAGFSIDAGRLAWVTPPGQDGEGSLVRVLAWSGDSFGQVQTFPAERLYMVR